MDIGEAVNVTVAGFAESKEEFCEKNPDDTTGWKARVDGYGATPTAKQLYTNMKNAEYTVPELPKRSKGKWDLFDCSRSKFPFQSHHLIPKKYLPELAVCVWLTAKWKDDPNYVLEKDAPFDTDHERNGYFMPFASSTAQWKEHKGDEEGERNVCFEMMRRVGIQLHQGSHTEENFGEDIDGIETSGYLTFVKKLLDLVYKETLKHVKTCDTCKKSASGGKIKVAPIESVAGHVYGVAETTRAVIDGNRIFVSERACQYFKATRKKPIPSPFLTT